MATTMWALNRYDRPGWVTGLCITVSFLCAIFAGGIEFWEVRRRKKLQKQGKVAPCLDVVKRNSETIDRKEDVNEIV
jgi:hypothetical protein